MLLLNCARLFRQTTHSIVSAFAAVLTLAGTSAAAAPPNVVVILTDDLAWSDIGCYGGEVHTPNLDALASNGLRFRRFYNGARCSPTRGALLTGLYPQQMAVDPGASLPNLRTDNNVTIAENLRANGYRTYMAGKWNLGNGTMLPENRGFQHQFRFANGTAHSAGNWNSGEYTFVSQNNEIPTRTYASGAFYQTDVIGDYSVDFLNHHASKGDNAPFFLYMAFGAPHFPLQAPAALVDSYVPVYSNGWDSLRNDRHARMLTEGVIDSRYILTPRGGTAPHNTEPIEEIPAWDTLGSDRKADLARRMAVYAAMIDKVDQNVGRVVTRLQELGQLNNTLIFFLSDNGGNFEGGRFGLTGSTVNAAPVTGAALANMGQVGQPVLYLGGGWANACNTPFRLFKHFGHEGGIRTPFIVHWPAELTRNNQWEEHTGHVMDIAATVYDVAGVSYPTQYAGHSVLPLEGVSLKPLFTSTNAMDRSFGVEHESNRTWFHDKWKLVTKNFTLYDGSSGANELELYDIDADPVEMHNLAADQPARVSQMVNEWNTWATRVGVPANRLLTFTPNYSPAPSPNDLFLDTFDRPNLTNADSSDVGMSGSRKPPLGPNTTYYEGFEGSGVASSTQTANKTLQMAFGPGMSENGIAHNFVGQDIIDAGGFSVELNIQAINTDATDTTNRYVGFGVGLSQAEAATGADINNTPPAGAVAFRGAQGGNTGVADFFVELDLNGNVKVWRNGGLLNSTPVGVNHGTLTAAFALNGFSTTSTVAVTVFFNGKLVDINTGDSNSVTRTFTWDRNNSNYIGVSARASNYAQMDNLAIRKLPLSTALATDYAIRAGFSGADTAPDADPEGDNVSNFGEWAFGGNAAVEDQLEQSLNLTQVSPGNSFQFEYRRLKDFAPAGIRYGVWYSEDLSEWTPTSVNMVSTAPIPGTLDYETARVELPPAVLAGKTHLFVRLVAEPEE